MAELLMLVAISSISSIVKLGNSSAIISVNPKKLWNGLRRSWAMMEKNLSFSELSFNSSSFLSFISSIRLRSSATCSGRLSSLFIVPPINSIIFLHSPMTDEEKGRSPIAIIQGIAKRPLEIRKDYAQSGVPFRHRIQA